MKYPKYYLIEIGTGLENREQINQGAFIIAKEAQFFDYMMKDGSWYPYATKTREDAYFRSRLQAAACFILHYPTESLEEITHLRLCELGQKKNRNFDYVDP